jgi:hypothetical protein
VHHPLRLSPTLLLGLALGVPIILPFVLFGDRLGSWTRAWLLDRRGSRRSTTPD